MHSFTAKERGRGVSHCDWQGGAKDARKSAERSSLYLSVWCFWSCCMQLNWHLRSCCELEWLPRWASNINDEIITITLTDPNYLVNCLHSNAEPVSLITQTNTVNYKLRHIPTTPIDDSTGAVDERERSRMQTITIREGLEEQTMDNHNPFAQLRLLCLFN